MMIFQRDVNPNALAWDMPPFWKITIELILQLVHMVCDTGINLVVDTANERPMREGVSMERLLSLAVPTTKIIPGDIMSLKAYKLLLYHGGGWGDTKY